jgi:hypothetical protein
MFFADSPLDAGQVVVGQTVVLDLLASSRLSLTEFSSLRLASSDLNSSTVQRNSMQGNRQNNRLRGRVEADLLYGRAGNDRLSGLSGDDKIYGQQGNDQLLGGGGKDDLSGGAGDDQLLGGKDADQLVGGLGQDRLNGGAGRNRLTGGAGRDRFVGTGAGVAEITDFQDGKDLIELGTGLKFADLTIVQGRGKQVGNTLIHHQVTGKTLIILHDTSSITISAADFLGVALPVDLEPISPDSNSPALIDPISIEPMPSDLVPPVLIAEPPLSGAITLIEPSVSIQANTIKFSASDPEAKIAATGAARIQLGTQTLYIGTQQVTSINQDPVIVSFDSSNPAKNWVRTDYEMTGTDGRGYGLFWSGTQLYGVFSVDGTQGTADQDFRRVSSGATQSWLRSYGVGGGAKVAVLAKLNPATGEMTDAVYLSAINSGKSNSLAIDGLTTNATGNLVVSAKSYFAPRRPDGKPMTQTGTGGSPFDYTLEITPDLKTVVSTSAVGWS